MKTICIMNLKGGVGKTVTADNMAAILAADHGKRVLLIDADHQGNTSTFFQADREADSLRELFAETAAISVSRFVQKTAYENLDIIAASMSLAELDALPEQVSARVWRMRELLEEIRKAGAYDFVIIDMPPAFSLAARASLAAADEVIVPIKLDAFSVDGMAELLRQIASMRKVNPGLTLAGVLITMWHNVDVVTQPEAILRSGNVPVFTTVIPHTYVVDKSTHERKPLHIFSPTSGATKGYQRLAAEYLERGRGNG